MASMFTNKPRPCSCGHVRVDLSDQADLDGALVVVHGVMHCFTHLAKRSR